MAGTTDAAPTGNGTQALIENSSFERADCTSWRWNGATAESAPLARDGERSCRICARTGVSVYGLEQSVPLDRLTPGVTYVASAWVRADEQRSASSDLRIGLMLDRGPHTSPLDGNEQSIGPASPVWTLATKSLSYAPIDGATHMTFELINRGADGGCFLIDAVTLAPSP